MKIDSFNRRWQLPFKTVWWFFGVLWPTVRGKVRGCPKVRLGQDRLPIWGRKEWAKLGEGEGAKLGEGEKAKKLGEAARRLGSG